MTAARRLTILTGAMLALFASFWTSAAAEEPAAAATAPEFAADLDVLIAPAGLSFTPAVGHWLEYRYVRTDSEPARTFIIAVIRRESYKGRVATWLEIKTESRNQTPVVLHVLASFSPQDGRPEIQRLVVRTGDFHAVEYPLPTLPLPKPITARSLWTELEEETVTVVAGEFAAQVFRREKPDGEVQTLWFSPSLAPFGLLRTESTAGKLDLIAYGRDYVTTPMPEPTLLAPRQAGTPPSEP
jgi:hypothetical protein